MGVFYKLLRSLILIVIIINVIPTIFNFFSVNVAYYFIFLIWFTSLLLFYALLPSDKNLTFNPEFVL